MMQNIDDKFDCPPILFPVQVHPDQLVMRHRQVHPQNEEAQPEVFFEFLYRKVALLLIDVELYRDLRCKHHSALGPVFQLIFFQNRLE